MRYLLVASAALLSPTLLTAQEHPSDTLLTVNRYLDFESVSQPKVSPDGSQVFWTRSSVDKMKDQFETGLWLMNADGSKQRFLVKGSNAVWSPDGTRIAYLAEAEPGGNQIWVRYMDAEGAITQVTREQKASANIKWSPDGKSIGFSMFVPSVPSWKIDLPSAPPGANWTKAPRLVEALHYRADRQGFLDAGYTHLFVVPAIGGTPRQITKGEWNVGARGTGLPGSVGWDWAPDGQSVAFHRDVAGTLQVFVLDVRTRTVRQLTSVGRNEDPTWAPDSRHLAFVSDRSGYRQLWIIDLDTGRIRPLLQQSGARLPAWSPRLPEATSSTP